MITFIVALATNLHGVMVGFMVGAIIGLVISAIVFGVAKGDEAEVLADLASSLMKKFGIAVVILALLSAVPTAEHLVAARIDLIKLELASDENVRKGVETIERIGRGLECKYLGSSCSENSK